MEVSMAWHEIGESGKYFINFRIGKQRFSRSLKTDDAGEADSAVACVEENLRLLERGRLEIPREADVVSFLLSNGKVSAPIRAERVTLKVLFDKYFAALPV